MIKTDAYGNEIPRYGQGWGKDESLKNRIGYNKDGTIGGYFSRSVAVVGIVLLNNTTDGKLYVLANQRGQGCPDYNGYWNLPCGYLDYNETVEEACSREIFEETGLNIPNSKLNFFSYSSNPNENKQNVVFAFITKITDAMENYSLSKENMEEQEVENIKWIPIDEKLNNYKWAYDHYELIVKSLMYKF